MRTVRTTMQPDKEIEVGDAEFLDLQRQGLLVDDDNTAPDPSATATPTPPASPVKKTSPGVAGSKES
ncbi:hypothetical protein OG342_04855 [Streptomyces bobili]|uniref:hypothetical protein n=1 Tax=Streptomyces bobili TaxID=67280 RepID=UPI0022597979|nr:hypothetical protein [Streptomyces bobili]MCX5522198.1 hypothetical protein [Streptomyces bobili]